MADAKTQCKNLISFRERKSDISPAELQYKPIQVIHEYMDYTKRERDYYHGYISNTEKLRQFLDEYRQVTNMSFTVRSSRSYIKKRAMNAMRKSASTEGDNLVIGATQTLENELIIDENNKEKITKNLTMNDDNLCHKQNIADLVPKNESESILIPLSPIDSKDKENNVMMSEELPLDGLITGPLRWEYILGKPPIPFTGVPFFIIGNTQYQCFYASADVRTQRRKASMEKSIKENPSTKTRIRRSLKRDCKAIMCIKSIVAFPEYTVEETISGVKSKKGCRKIKAAALENVRQAVEKGETVGHPAFWVCIPLPEAHTTHDISLEASQQAGKAIEALPESMDAITHILNVAAQYGGKVQIVQQGDENIIEFQLDSTVDDGEGEGDDEIHTGGEQIDSQTEQLLSFDETSLHNTS